MHGARRVVIFCLLTAVLPAILLIIPLYLRHNIFADVVFSVAESDVLKIDDGISTIFCREHTLRMNSSFNAYQLESEPEISSTRKHIHLKKSMSLPDDTIEYWGFFLPKGSQMGLTVCSKSDGARILVVKGEKNFKTCGLLDHSNTKKFISPVKVADGQDQVRVIFETVAQEVATNASDLLSLMLEEKNEVSNMRHPRSVYENEIDFNDAREVEDTNGMKAFMFLKKLARDYMYKYHNETNYSKLRTVEENLVGHRLRHAGKKSTAANKLKTNKLSNWNIENRIRAEEKARERRNILKKTAHSLDVAKVAHGGNAINFTEADESSASSFETTLFNCYDGQILLNHMVPASDLCGNTSFLMSNKAKITMTTTHNVSHDGYYYYIFYSDNDYVQNNIHATFDIFKPTYQYSNFSKSCTNKTECNFSLIFFSSQQVIVEVPTRNGIEPEGDDITHLLSICQPRMSVYIIFPVMVLFLILGCAFL